jgi:hypothetical protein
MNQSCGAGQRTRAIAGKAGDPLHADRMRRDTKRGGQTVEAPLVFALRSVAGTEDDLLRLANLAVREQALRFADDLDGARHVENPRVNYGLLVEIEKFDAGRLRF